jgi:hypothetical protein
MLVELRAALILGLLTGSVSVQSQNTKIIPPATNAMKMTEYYGQRPGMYAGTANVTIPLYSINFDGWELPLTLSCNAMGVRTNEEAGEAGLGWTLNATGAITRTIRGCDDLYPAILTGRKGYVYNARPLPHQLGYVFNPLTPNAIPDPTSYYAYIANEKADTELDVFNLSFFGFTSSFVLSQKASTAGRYQGSGNQKLGTCDSL